MVRWAYAPGEVSIQITSDGINWEEKIPWRACRQAGGNFFAWWYPNAFSETFEFDEPLWVQSVRVLMRNPVSYYFGIYQVKAWTKQWIVMLKSAELDEVN